MVGQGKSEEEDACGYAEERTKDGNDMIVDLTGEGWKKDESEIVDERGEDGCLWG